MLLSRLIPRTRTFADIRWVSSLSKWATFDPETNTLKSTIQVNVPEETFGDHVWKHHRNWETKPALTCAASGRSLTYGQVHGAFKRLGENLGPVLGLKAGDVVGLVLPNVPEFAIAFYGAASAALVITPANPLYTRDELAKQFTDANLKAVVTLPSFLSRVRAALKQRPQGMCPIILVGGDTDKKKDLFSLHDLSTRKIKGSQSPTKADPSSTLVIPYSSGTTGQPKGVILSHRNLVAALCVANHPDAINHSPQGPFQEVTLAAIPLFHIYGIVNILGLCLGRGYYVVTLPQFEPKSFAETFAKYKPTYMCLVPPLMAFVARSPLISKDILRKLKFAANAAAPLSMKIVDELKLKSGNPNLIVKNGFGLTETSAMVTVTPEGFTKESIGPPSANVEVTIADEAGKALPLGAQGELCVRGPQVMQGYLNNPEASRNTLSKDGWLRTGDVGFVDPEDGHIYLVDRIKELIKVKGYQVSPTELEMILIKMEGISDVAVVGVPDGVSGEVPKAFVVRKGGSQVSEADVQDFLLPKVAKYKQLRGGVVFLDAIPKSAAGKTLKRQLVAL